MTANQHPRPARPNIEGIVRRRPQPLQIPETPPPRPASRQPIAAIRRPAAPVVAPVSRPARPRAAWLEWLQYPVIAVAALAAAFNSTAGQVLVLIFGLYAIWRKLPARLSFGAALFVLLTIPLFQVLGRAGIAENAAIYVYELLVIGTISAVIELRKSGDSDN